MHLDAGGNFIPKAYGPVWKEKIRKGEPQFDWDDVAPLSGSAQVRKTLGFNVVAHDES